MHLTEIFNSAMSGNDFWTSGTGTRNGKFRSHFSGTGIQVENSNPIFGNGNGNEIPFPFSGTGMRVKNSIPDFRDGNWRTVFPGIPGNSQEREWHHKIGSIFCWKFRGTLP